MVFRIAFYPTLAYNLFRNFVQPERWSWYNRVNESLILGAMPFQSMLPELIKEGVGGVVCCTEEFELDAAWGAVRLAEWAKWNIEVHHTPMQDFYGSTSQQNIEQAVQFIERIVSEGKTCYVHCKAGRTRSATIAMCFLMQKYDHSPEEAMAVLKNKRPQVVLHELHWQSIKQFHERKISNSNGGETEKQN